MTSIPAIVICGIIAVIIFRLLDDKANGIVNTVKFIFIAVVLVALVALSVFCFPLGIVAVFIVGKGLAGLLDVK